MNLVDNLRRPEMGAGHPAEGAVIWEGEIPIPPGKEGLGKKIRRGISAIRNQWTSIWGLQVFQGSMKWLRIEKIYIGFWFPQKTCRHLN